MTYNIYCLNCKKILKKESPNPNPVKLKCPICGKESKVVGKSLNVLTSNGPYSKHL